MEYPFEHQEYYEDHSILLQKESENDDWYIIVHSDAGYSYDGWWRDSADKTQNEAFAEALNGACLKKNPTPLPEKTNPVRDL